MKESKVPVKPDNMPIDDSCEADEVALSAATSLMKSENEDVSLRALEIYVEYLRETE